jgi:hypothetical protein
MPLPTEDALEIINQRNRIPYIKMPELLLLPLDERRNPNKRQQLQTEQLIHVKTEDKTIRQWQVSKNWVRNWLLKIIQLRNRHFDPPTRMIPP